MNVVVFMSRTGVITDAVNVGRALLVDGTVRFTGDLAPDSGSDVRAVLESATVFDRRGQPLQPSDGERYLESCRARSTARTFGRHD